jgi:pimeloyl-ACP methyl ester carboxylesterase
MSISVLVRSCGGAARLGRSASGPCPRSSARAPPSDGQHGEVRTDLEVTELGDGEERVVFVHGVLDRGRSFDRVAEQLTGECRMAWYDRRGYATSVEADGGPVDVAGHVLDLLDVLDGRAAVVVGHSFGGVTVLSTALQAPELVQAAVLYETGMAWIPGWEDSHMRELLWQEDAEHAAVRMMLGDRLDALSAETRAQRLQEGAAFVAEERSVRTGAPPFHLADLPVPLVYGIGANPIFGTVAAHLTEVVPEVQIATIDGAGHNAHRSHPEAFADLVRRGITAARARR